MQLRNRFSQRARRAMQAAEKIARLFGHHAIDTEHVLLALVDDGSGKAVEVLKGAGVDEKILKARVEYTARYANSTATDASKSLKPTAQAQSVIEYAIDEARNLNHNYVGSEHLLLGLLREQTGLAAEILIEFGLTAAALRKEIQALIAAESEAQSAPNPRVNDAERAFFLALYRSAVAFYKPRIEQRTGIHLGDIVVRDYAYFHEDAVKEFREWASRGRLAIIRRLIFRRRVRSFAQTAESFYAKHASQCAASYHRSTIYVSFESGTAHDYAIASMTVHELSHALWEKLAQDSFDASRAKAKRAGGSELEKYNIFVEGFATYAERTWFLDIYPMNLRQTIQQNPLTPNSVYCRGFRLVKRLVKQHGQQVLMDIPKRWRELDVPDGWE
jgi:Clp amino terminal domain, pathogenicity island component